MRSINCVGFKKNKKMKEIKIPFGISVWRHKDNDSFDYIVFRKRGYYTLVIQYKEDKDWCGDYYILSDNKDIRWFKDNLWCYQIIFKSTTPKWTGNNFLKQSITSTDIKNLFTFYNETI